MSVCKNIEFYKNRLELIDYFYINDNDINRSVMNNWEVISFKNHCKRVKTIQEASLIIYKVFTINELKNLSDYLSINNDSLKYYLICIRVNLDHDIALLDLNIFKMINVYFYTFDLRDHILLDDNISPLRGITIPSPYKFNSEIKNISRLDKKYLFSFKGNCKQNGWFGCANVRQKLKQLTKLTKNQIEYDFLFEDTSDSNINTDKQLYENILMNSVYSLVLHGDGRWSHRLIETFGSGAIPIIIADGLTLPFEQIIDYSNACIIIEESVIYNAIDIKELIDILPKDENTINKLRTNSLKIYDMFFKSDELICDMLLLCAKMLR